MTLPLALSASSYNEDDASGTTIHHIMKMMQVEQRFKILKHCI